MNVRLDGGGQRSRFRPGVSAEHHNYKWWALSCTSLGMLLATDALPATDRLAA